MSFFDEQSFLPDVDEDLVCEVCGCTESDPCIDAANEPCFWVEPGLCSVCVDVSQRGAPRGAGAPDVLFDELGSDVGLEPVEPGFYKAGSGLWLPR